MRSSLFVLVACVGVAACSSSSTSSPSTSGGGSGNGADGGSTAADDGGSSADTDAGSGSTGSGGMNGCKAASYTDASTGTANDRMIMISSGAFDMPCMTIAAGQSVMFMWDLATYPLEPGLSPAHTTDTAGTAPSPITEKTSGSIATIKFAAAGMYPFYVKGHNTMSGVIEVK